MDSDDTPSCSGSSKLSEQDSTLITQSKDQFDRSEFDECLQTLTKLETSMGSNQKISHNRAIVEFFKSGCKNYDDLLTKLENLALDETNKIKATTFSTKDTNLSPIAVYNISVINFYKQKFYTAIKTLSPLLDKLFDLDEKTSELVGILMINLLLETNQYNRAQALIDSIQNQLTLRNERLSPEDSSFADKGVNQEFIQKLKFLSKLVQVLNKKIVSLPDDKTLEEAELKARQYYLMNDFQMASRQLMKIKNTYFSLQSCGDLDACIANNMGIINLRVRHYALAAKFFQNALNFERQNASDLRNASLQHLGSVRTRETLYNLGIAMLHSKRPIEAFKCFLTTLRTYHSNPRLWLRLAQACMMNYEMALAKGNFKLANSSGRANKNSRKAVIKLDENSLPSTATEPSLEFALLCLRSSLTLTKLYQSQLAETVNKPNEEIGESWKNAKDSNFCNPSMPISNDAFDTLLTSIHAALSYVSLHIGDYMTAYHEAQELLRMEKLSDAYKMLAHMYIGQALVMMERLGDARLHFQPSLFTALDTTDFETKNWDVKSLDAAQAIAQYNLVVVMILQGEYEAARNMLQSCTHPLVASKAIGLKLFLETVISQTS